MTIQTIDDVIYALEDIIETSRRENSRLGFFAALYRKVTIRVKQGIASGRFEDGERMERLDVLFAQRYLNAYEQFRRNQQPTASWLYTFQMAQQPHPLIIQHILLGINAHINLDLGIAAFETVQPEHLINMRHDYEEINNVLEELLDEMQENVSLVSPELRKLDDLGGEWDEILFSRVLTNARRSAWWKARRLARINPESHDRLISRFDVRVSQLARRICPPIPSQNAIVHTVRTAESEDIGKILDVLL